MNRIGAWERSLRYLTQRPRTEKQIRDYLHSKGYENSEIEDTIIRLKENNYINDRLYAEGFVRSRAENKLHGKHRLRRDLLIRGIAKSTAEEAIENYFQHTDEAEILNKAIDKWLRIHGKTKDIQSIKRLHNFLFRLGFESALFADKLRGMRKDYEE